MRIMFWLFTGLLLAVATHLSYVLFVPRSQFSESVSQTLAEIPSNTFGIMAAQSQAALMPFASSSDLVGLCKFDLTKGSVKLSIEVKGGYWEFAVYTLGGQQVYALNDKQAGTTAFNVTLSKSASLFEQITQTGAEDTFSGDIGWRVSVNEAKGLAFLWMPHSDGLRRAEAELALGKSKCEVLKAQ